MEKRFLVTYIWIAGEDRGLRDEMEVYAVDDAEAMGKVKDALMDVDIEFAFEM